MAVQGLDSIEMPGIRDIQIDEGNASIDEKGGNNVTNNTSRSEEGLQHQAGTSHLQVVDEPAKVRSKLRTIAVMAAIYVSLCRVVLLEKKEKFANRYDGVYSSHYSLQPLIKQ